MLKNKINGVREILKFDNRFEIIYHHLFHSQSKLGIYRFSGYEVIILRSGGDVNGMRACVATPQYSQFLTDLQFGRKIRILDLGAHTGGFIFCMAKYGFEIEQSISIEQNSETFTRLRFNLEHNFERGQCESINAGVWPEDMPVVSSGGTGSTSGRLEWSTGESSESQLIPGMTINKILDQFPSDVIIDLCKIDIEGAEWQVFDNFFSCSELKNRCKYIIIEIHDVRKGVTNLLSRLKNMGFEVQRKCQYGDETYLLKNVSQV